MARRLAPDSARQFAATSDFNFKFQKSRQLFIRVHNETLSVVAMRVNDPDRLPVGINCGDAAPTPSGFAEIVSDDFPILHGKSILTDFVSFALHTAMTK